MPEPYLIHHSHATSCGIIHHGGVTAAYLEKTECLGLVAPDAAGATVDLATTLVAIQTSLQMSMARSSSGQAWSIKASCALIANLKQLACSQFTM